MTRLADALKRAQHPSRVEDHPEPVADSAFGELPAQPDSSAGPAMELPSASEAPADALNRRWLSRGHLQVGDPSSHLPHAPNDFADRLARKLVIDPQARPVAVEQYRRLAAALHHAQVQSGIKVVMVTSAVVAEGKSLSVVNLALTLSHSYRMRVLLIDGDLRRPSLQEIFKLPPTAGLNEGLRGREERELPLYEVSHNLVVLPAGRPDADPVGSLTSDRMGRVIAEAAQEFDWVLIDTPPIGLVSDAALLGALADTVVLVVRAGASPCALVRLAVETLGTEKIFGVLLNAVDNRNVGKADGYYAYGHSPKAGPR
jgi:receptor protein-tyrosine kinase